MVVRLTTTITTDGFTVGGPSTEVFFLSLPTPLTVKLEFTHSLFLVNCTNWTLTNS